MTYKLESIFTFAFANKESLIVAFPSTVKLESIRTLDLAINESLIVAFPVTFIFPATLAFAFAINESVTVAFPVTYKLESILAFNLSAFRLILFDNETVSLPILLDNIAEVSDKFNFAPEVAPVANAKAPTF